MFWAIKGELCEIFPSKAIIEINGLYYEINISLKTFEKYKDSLNDLIFLYTYFNVKENIQELYGFNNLKEKDFFLKLLQVPGIGAKKAMEILNFNDIETYITAINNGNQKPFERVKGIGKKQAQKIILELSGKLTFTTKEYEKSDKQIFEGLKNLGFSDQDIQKAIDKFYKMNKNSITFEEKFKIILSYCSKV